MRRPGRFLGLRAHRAILSMALLATSGPAHAQGPGDGAPSDPSWPLVDVSVANDPGLVTLESKSGPVWTPTSCITPCHIRLNPMFDYRISGPGVVDSDPIRLPADSKHVRLDATVGSSALHAVAAWLTIGGVVFVAAGGATLLLPAGDQATADEKTSKTVVGVSFLAAGLLTAALGVVLRSVFDTSVSVRAEAP